MHRHFRLAEILPTLDYVPQTLPSGAVVYPDAGWRSDRQRVQLWQLRDYQVSSVSGGSIWLLPRDGGLQTDGRTEDGQ